MKITDIATYMVDFGVSNYIFVKVYTDEGIEGVGEATLEGKELSVLGAIEEMKRILSVKTRATLRFYGANGT